MVTLSMTMTFCLDTINELYLPPNIFAWDCHHIRSKKAELQKSCGHAGITREEGLPYVRSVRKVKEGFEKAIFSGRFKTLNFTRRKFERVLQLCKKAQLFQD